MFKEFKEFAMRGNVVDMAVWIIMGGAFGTIVKSLVSDVLMPPIGLLQRLRILLFFDTNQSNSSSQLHCELSWDVTA